MSTQSKFTHLSIGQIFHFQGQTYQKTSPLLASDMQTGKGRMIPRSAIVSLDNASEVQSAPAQTLKQVPYHRVASAAEHFRDLCLHTLREAAGTQDSARLGVLGEQIEKAHHDFLARIRDAVEEGD